MAALYPNFDMDGTLAISTRTETSSSYHRVIDEAPGPIIKEQMLYIWSPIYEKWQECMVTLKVPVLYITEYDDLRTEINERQLLHLKANWYHGNLTRREAKCILMDHNGGNGSFLVRASESYHGKFAISFVHEFRVKHVVVESKREREVGIMYNITPNGPYFTSLFEVIEEAKRSPIIQNHMFDIVLTTSPSKIDMRWLHFKPKTYTQVRNLLSRDFRDGAFLVYRTHSEDVPYKLVYRSEGDVFHENIVATQRPNPGYQLNNITAPVLYKVINYFMENPIRVNTFLKYPVEEIEPQISNNAVALHDYDGRKQNGLNFYVGSLITNIKPTTLDWYTGDFRGDRERWLPKSSVRLLNKDEWLYIRELHRIDHEDDSHRVPSAFHTLSLAHYALDVESKENEEISFINLVPLNPSFKGARDYKLGSSSSASLKEWCQVLQDFGRVCRVNEEQGNNSKNCVIS